MMFNHTRDILDRVDKQFEIIESEPGTARLGERLLTIEARNGAMLSVEHIKGMGQKLTVSSKVEGMGEIVLELLLTKQHTKELIAILLEMI